MVEFQLLQTPQLLGNELFISTIGTKKLVGSGLKRSSAPQLGHAFFSWDILFSIILCCKGTLLLTWHYPSYALGNGGGVLPPRKDLSSVISFNGSHPSIPCFQMSTSLLMVRAANSSFKRSKETGPNCCPFRA